MCNDVQLGEVIRGHTGTINFDGGNSFRITPPEDRRPPRPSGRRTRARAASRSRSDFNQNGDRDTRALWDHYMECLRSRNVETLCPAETGYAAIATVNLGVDSYRYGKAYYFDKATGKTSDADGTWSKKWEAVSHERGKPVQIDGWKADAAGGLDPHRPGLSEARRRLGQRRRPRHQGLISQIPAPCHFLHDARGSPPRASS